METLKRLFDLQTIDLQIKENEERLKRLIAAGDGSPLGEIEARLQARESELQLLKREMKDLELEVESYSEKINKLHREMFSGKGGAKDLMEKQVEVDTLKHRRERAEDKLLELMERLETLQPEMENARQDLEKQREASVEDGVAREKEKTELQAELGNLRSEHEAVEIKVPEEFLSYYKKQRVFLLGKVVVRLNGERCGGCGIQLASRLLYDLRTSDRLIHCENCGRYLLRGNNH